MLDIKRSSFTSSGDEEHKMPAIKVTAMPGKHVPTGIATTFNNFLKAVRLCFRRYLKFVQVAELSHHC